jgi:hypothetical protein
MNQRELFGVGVRLFGIWLITQGVSYFAAFVDMKLYPTSERVREGATAYLVYVIMDLSLAAFFLLWTRAIVAWSYGEDREAAGAEAPAGRDSVTE